MSAIIYRITNTVNGKCYIGQTYRNLETRWTEHCRCAKQGVNTHLYAAIRKYGSSSFDQEILESVSLECVNERESYWIETLSPAYNMTKGGDGLRGVVHSTESRLKMREAALNRSPETKEKIRAALKGRKLSPEHRAKISASRCGKSLSTETRAKLSVAMSGDRNPQYGKRASIETRAKLSAARLGVPKTLDHKIKIGAAHEGRKLSPEHRAKISASKKKNK
jgi:plasmid stability protein